MKGHRLRWLGHLESMGADRSAKNANRGLPSGRRPVGCSRYLWMDVDVIAVLRELWANAWQMTEHCPRWRQVANSRAGGQDSF
jgi:hypothetical protein